MGDKKMRIQLTNAEVKKIEGNGPVRVCTIREDGTERTLYAVVALTRRATEADGETMAPRPVEYHRTDCRAKADALATRLALTVRAAERSGASQTGDGSKAYQTFTRPGPVARLAHAVSIARALGCPA